MVENSVRGRNAERNTGPRCVRISSQILCKISLAIQTEVDRVIMAFHPHVLNHAEGDFGKLLKSARRRTKRYLVLIQFVGSS